MHRLDLVERDFVIAANTHLLAEFAQVLHEVVGERIVIIDHQQHDCRSSAYLH
ncbi:hypothetical protein D3C83_55240 [compost metagenome]